MGAAGYADFAVNVGDVGVIQGNHAVAADAFDTTVAPALGKIDVVDEGATLIAVKGGTGVGSFTAGRYLVGSGADTIDVAADHAPGIVVIPNDNPATQTLVTAQGYWGGGVFILAVAAGFCGRRGWCRGIGAGVGTVIAIVALVVVFFDQGQATFQ